MSVEQQKKELIALAEREGYIIVAWYIDDGKSGSLAIEKRKDFLRMIEDSYRKEWQVILCWDAARFGRLNPHLAGGYKQTLKNNGVHLHTVKEGVIKWETGTDYLIDTVHAVTAHEYSRSLSKDTIRGRLDLLAAGYYPNGRIAFGYDKLYVSPEGDEYRIPRNKTFKKGRGWKRYIIRNEAEAEVVRLIFTLYLEHDLSLREIARRIIAPRPDGSGKPWTKDTVRDTLSNKVYAGYGIIGGRGRLRAKEAHNRIGYHEQAGCVEAIISLEDWQRAQEKLAQNKEEGRKVRPATSSRLTGVLVCGHCGYRLAKHSRTDKKGQRYSYFSCESAIKRPAMGCKQWRIREDDALPPVIDWLITAVDRAKLELSASRPGEEDSQPSDLDSLQRALAEVKARIDRGAENYLTAPESLKPLLEAKLAAWQEEREELERKQRYLTVTQGDISSFNKWWDEARGDLVTVLPIEWETRKQSVARDGEFRVEKLTPEQADVLPSEIINGTEIIDGKEWTYAIGDFPVKPAVMMRTARFRQVLRDLGFTVKVYWAPAGSRYYQVDRLVPEVGGEHAAGGNNNRHSHARSRDTG
jgi:site-specific DNA recombinase